MTIKLKVIALVCSAGAIAALVSAVWFIGAFVYTPTTNVTVHNNISQRVELSGCGSDSITLDPGESGSVDATANDPNGACIVYLNNGGTVLGCLHVPTSGEAAQIAFELSTYIKGVPAGRCGD